LQVSSWSPAPTWRSGCRVATAVPMSVTTRCGRALRRARSTCAWCYTGWGPGAGGPRDARWGEHVEISRSRALPIALDRSVKTHLFLGDETSIASAEALTRALPAETVVFACFEVASMDHRWPETEVARPEKVRWVDRAGRPGSALVSWLARQSLPFTNSTTAYVTGEAWLCAMVHAHLVRDRGFPAGAVRAMPYWKTRFRSS
jgi:NADPH-dependent ferric siderophore reductase